MLFFYSFLHPRNVEDVYVCSNRDFVWRESQRDAGVNADSHDPISRLHDTEMQGVCRWRDGLIARDSGLALKTDGEGSKFSNVEKQTSPKAWHTETIER